MAEASDRVRLTIPVRFHQWRWASSSLFVSDKLSAKWKSGRWIPPWGEMSGLGGYFSVTDWPSEQGPLLQSLGRETWLVPSAVGNRSFYLFCLLFFLFFAGCCPTGDKTNLPVFHFLHAQTTLLKTCRDTPLQTWNWPHLIVISRTVAPSSACRNNFNTPWADLRRLKNSRPHPMETLKSVGHVLHRVSQLFSMCSFMFGW